MIPPGVTVMPSVLAIHMLPEYWGDDAAQWRPKRWIRTNREHQNVLAEQLARENILTPRKGIYFPWSEGVQNCPGQKFSQVEFAAVMAVLFRSHRVRPLLDRGETDEDAHRRLMKVAGDCDVSLLLRVRDADSTRLIWESF